jgi:hypothetical protein
MEPNFCGFLWSPSLIYWDKIIHDLHALSPIISYKIYDFKDEYEIFKHAINDIYKIDDIDIKKIENIKIKSMKPYLNKFICFQFYITDPNFRKKSQTGCQLSTVVESIKKTLRTKYKPKIKNYVHDIIIHIADNLEQTIEINKLMESYAKYQTHEFVNLKYFLKCNYINDNFNRVDMLVRKYSVEQYKNSNEFNFEFYNKMQKKRLNVNKSDKYITDFKNLIINVMKNGIDLEQPIKYYDKYTLFDGSHRLSFCYYNNYIFIPVKNDHTKANVRYGYDWFSSRFNKNELEIIDNELIKLKEFINK